MMNAKLFLAVFMTIFVVESVNGDFNEAEFEAKRKEKNVFVLFVKDIHFGEFNNFYIQVKGLYDEDKASSLAFEKVECPQNEKFCESHNIKELMELKYFAKDKTDNTKMFNFIQDRIKEALTMHANEDAAKAKIKEGRSFVKFYSPGCSACTTMANTWTDLEKQYEKNDAIKIFSIDCSKTKMVCKKFKILHYPTMIYFDQGKAKETYAKAWNLKEFSAFIDEQLKVVEPVKNETVNHVVILTAETFNQTVAKGVTFVKFNLRGCSHCVVLDPAWKAAAAMVADIEGVRLAEMECMESYAFCVSQRAKGFPTLTVYKDGELVKHDYYEDITSQGFYNCAMAYHIGGEHLENWLAVQQELKTKRRAAKKAAIAAAAAAAAAGNVTVTNNDAHH